jgi:hypothetical protein
MVSVFATADRPHLSGEGNRLQILFLPTCHAHRATLRVTRRILLDVPEGGPDF